MRIKYNDRDVTNCNADLQKTIQKCYDFTEHTLFLNLYMRRRYILKDFPHVIDLELLAIDYLMTCIDRTKCCGINTDVQMCNTVITKCINSCNLLDHVMMFAEKILLEDADKNPYIIKYFDVIQNEFMKDLGLINFKRHGFKDVNFYDFIDIKARPRLEEHPHDFGTMIQKFPTQAFAINHLFKMGNIASQIHKYPANTADLATLFSFYVQCKKDICYAIDIHELRSTYDGVVRQGKLSGDFDTFLETYVSGHTYAPVLVSNGKQYLFDGNTLFIFLIYISCLNDRIEGTQRISGKQAFMDHIKKTDAVFESQIRVDFRAKGWDVFPNEGERMTRRLDGEEYEYDCVAINHHSKLIVLAEAKYENMPPSAISEKNLVSHIVLDKKGLLHHAKRHHARSGFFRRYRDKMGLGLVQPFDYNLVSVIVTKYTPMINKHLTVHLMSYDRFKSFDFNTCVYK